MVTLIKSTWSISECLTLSWRLLVFQPENKEICGVSETRCPCVPPGSEQTEVYCGGNRWALECDEPSGCSGVHLGLCA